MPSPRSHQLTLTTLADKFLGFALHAHTRKRALARSSLLRPPWHHHGTHPTADGRTTLRKFVLTPPRDVNQRTPQHFRLWCVRSCAYPTPADAGCSWRLYALANTNDGARAFTQYHMYLYTTYNPTLKRACAQIP